MIKILSIFLTLGIFTYAGCLYRKTHEPSKLEVNRKVESKKEQKSVTQVSTSISVDPKIHSQTIKPFFQNYCFKCHNEDKQKGKLRLDNLEFNSDSLLVWQDVIDQLTTGDMPPEDEKMPGDSERKKLISSIQNELDKFGKKENYAVLRRLTQKEYINTIRDLFQMRTEVFMGASEFPPDERKHNFSNNGEALVTSSYLVDKYLDAANAVVDQILPEETSKPQPHKWTFTPPFRMSQRDYASWFYGHYNYQDILQNDTSLRDIYLTIDKFENGVPERGFYKIKITVEGRNRKKNPSPLGNKNEALSIKIAAGTKKDGEVGKSIKSDKFIGEFPLPDDQVQTIEFKTWMEKGYTPKFTFPQGLDTVKNATLKAYKKHRDSLIKDANFKKYMDPKQFSWLKEKNKQIKKGADTLSSRWAVFMEEYSKLYPTLRMYKVEIEGPFYNEWPHKPKSLLLNGLTYEECKPLEVIEGLAQRAFRRPVKKEEIKPILDFVKQTYDQTGSKREALANGIRAVLCSPQFFYHYENEGELDNFALASRLSYFIWSSMPDDRLMSLAETGKIKDRQILKSELERMLKDPRAEQLTFNLADQWLELWKLGSMAPDTKDEAQYYRRHLKTFSKFETTKLLEYILQKNKPIMEILNADYTFLNRGLAEFYGLKDFHKYPQYEFIKTKIPDNNRRGIFGHMGILTATANGVDTSPIIRGLWVYETMLGKPAPAPPDSVPAIEPDLRNAKTIRDKLVKHREDKNCSVCHKKFDHFGFALENFDHLGRWRTHYTDPDMKNIKIPISSYGTMINGDKFKDINEMRQLIAKDEQLFANTVASKLLTMAMGREVNAFDREEITKILDESKSQGNGLKDLLTSVVTSKLFKSK